MTGPADPETFAQGATSALEGSLHEATRQLALGDAEGATQVAKDIEEKATSLKKQYLDSTKSLDATEAQMTYLRGEGVLTNGLEAEIKTARDMVEKGLIEAAGAMPGRRRGGGGGAGARAPKAHPGVSAGEGPLGPGDARAEREELGGALKPGPWFSRRNGRALLCAAAESDASSGANSLRGPGSRVHVPDRCGRLLPGGDRPRDRASARRPRDRPVRADPRSRMRRRCDRTRRRAPVRGRP